MPDVARLLDEQPVEEALHPARQPRDRAMAAAPEARDDDVVRLGGDE